MARREGRRGPFAGVVSLLHQVVEQPVARNGQRLLMRQEIVVHGREMALRYLVDAHGLVVELRSGHGQGDEDDVEQEERAQDDEGAVGKALISFQQVVEGHGRYHGIVAEIAQAERLADPRRRPLLAEQQRRLAAKHRLLYTGEDVVEVGEETVELVGVGIPPSQQAQLSCHAQHHGQLRGPPAVELPQADGHDHGAAPAHEHGEGVDHAPPKHHDEQRREHGVAHHHPFKEAKPPVFIHHLLFIIYHLGLWP